MGKVEGYFFGGIGIFFAIVTVVYWFASKDPTGTTCLALSVGLAGLCAFYLSFTAKRTGPRPEDRDDADIAEGAGEIGHFSPGSYWPIAIAFSALLVMLGFVFGLWISFIGGMAMLMAISGLLFEHYRGNHLHTEEAVGIDPISLI
ncbi:MAG TPA: cytochrome c oxidase subunit 4 [Mycobacteriales bacterium]|jgi:hypothetical protein|nr:cytochrome c oxidase subunit 4 [Mycobacteriales bacterium]